MQLSPTMQWIDAKKNPPKYSGTYYVLLEYVNDGVKELVYDIGLFYNWIDKSHCSHSFWKAHPYGNKFLPVDNVAYYMNVPEKPKET